MKCHSIDRDNWGTTTNETHAKKDKALNSDDNKLRTEMSQEQEKLALFEETKDSKKGATNDLKEKKEDKEMTLEEYEKIKKEQWKALFAMKFEERKVKNWQGVVVYAATIYRKRKWCYLC